MFGAIEIYDRDHGDVAEHELVGGGQQRLAAYIPGPWARHLVIQMAMPTAHGHAARYLVPVE